MSFFIRGLILGLSIAAPVDPLGVLCIRRTVTQGRVIGFVSGLGAATADAIYGAIAGFGLTAVAHLLVGGQQVLRIVGGLFLFYLGVRTWRARPASGPPKADSHWRLSSNATTLGLTLTNPMTIFSFTAIFAGLGIAAGTQYSHAAMLVAGVFCGSAAWWLILSPVAGSFSHTLTTTGRRWVNRMSGAIITGFGALALLAAR